mgnify:CR=1 FL=1
MIYAIGDIHGCLYHLEKLFDLVSPDLENHQLVFMGDYIDRGPKSAEVVDFIINLKKRYGSENIICLMGNHERMFLDYLDGKDEMLFLMNGGVTTTASYWGEFGDRLNRSLPPEHWDFYTRLKLYYATDDYIFVHAGLKPGLPLADQVEDDILWIRKEFIASDYNFGRRVVFGHTPMRSPLIMANKIGIDTGAVYGNKLTCVLLPEEKFYSVAE